VGPPLYWAIRPDGPLETLATPKHAPRVGTG